MPAVSALTVVPWCSSAAGAQGAADLMMGGWAKGVKAEWQAVDRSSTAAPALPLSLWPAGC